MRHFSSTELVDAAEGHLASTRAAHLHACVRCRTEVDALASTLQSLEVEQVPEPSPLFWNRFSARVRDAVDAVDRTGGGAWPWFDPHRWLQAAVPSALIVAAVSGVWLAYSSRPPVPSSVGVAELTTAPASASNADVADERAAWAILTAAAADLKPDEAKAAGLTVRPGAVESAVLQLTPAERNELGRLLQNELKHSGD